MNRRLLPPEQEGHADEVRRYVNNTEDVEHDGTTVRLFYMHDGTVQTHVVGHGLGRCACGCGAPADPAISYGRMLLASDTAPFYAEPSHKHRARRHSVAVLTATRERLLRQAAADADTLRTALEDAQYELAAERMRTRAMERQLAGHPAPQYDYMEEHTA